MTTGTIGKLTYLLLSIVIISSFSSKSNAVESFTIETDVDTSYLPYYFIAEAIESSDKTSTLYRPTQVLWPAIKDSMSGSYIDVSNSTIDRPRPTTFSEMKAEATSHLIDDDPVRLTVNDWAVYDDNKHNLKAIAGCGSRNDSAFAFVLFPKSEEEPEYLFLTSGKDYNGDGKWNVGVVSLLVEDYDYDGFSEAFFYVNSGDDNDIRMLFCVELETLSIEWSLSISPLLTRDRFYSTRDSLNPSVIFKSYNPKNGIQDENFSDRYSYLTIIINKGNIIYKKIIALEYFSCHLIPSDIPGYFYLPHELDLTLPFDSTLQDRQIYYLSKITATGKPVKTISLDSQPKFLWSMPYKCPSNQSIYVQDHMNNIYVFDSNLQIQAEAK